MSELKNFISECNTTDEKFISILEKTSISVNGKSRILLLGESGVGKRHLAKKLHEYSNRSTKPFVLYHCANLSPEMAASTLFGQTKGAFTGATESSDGLIIDADGGTLFLNEIGALDLKVQRMLIPFLDDGSFCKVGEYKATTNVDVKTIFGSNSDLKDLVYQRQFVPDLYSRIRQRAVTIPPLRERRGDINVFVNRFLDELNIKCKHIVEIESDAMEKLSSFNWSDNVRQLKGYIIELYETLQYENSNKITNMLIAENPPYDKPAHEKRVYNSPNINKTLVKKWSFKITPENYVVIPPKGLFDREFYEVPFKEKYMLYLLLIIKHSQENNPSMSFQTLRENAYEYINQYFAMHSYYQALYRKWTGKKSEKWFEFFYHEFMYVVSRKKKFGVLANNIDISSIDFDILKSTLNSLFQ